MKEPHSSQGKTQPATQPFFQTHRKSQSVFDIPYKTLSKLSRRFLINGEIEDYNNFYALFAVHPKNRSYKIQRWTKQLDTGWVHFVPITPKRRRLTGWKFHFSIDHADMKRATPIFLTFLLNEKLHFLPQFKLQPTDKLIINKTKNNNAYGKEWIIYCDEQATDKQWLQLIILLEQALLAAKINPGHKRPEGDRNLPGSFYVGYRYAEDLKGRYMPATRLGYNPFNQPDPYKTFFMPSSPNPSPSKAKQTISLDKKRKAHSQSDALEHWILEGKEGAPKRIKVSKRQHSAVARLEPNAPDAKGNTEKDSLSTPPTLSL